MLIFCRAFIRHSHRPVESDFRRGKTLTIRAHVGGSGTSGSVASNVCCGRIVQGADSDHRRAAREGGDRSGGASVAVQIRDARIVRVVTADIRNCRIVDAVIVSIVFIVVVVVVVIFIVFVDFVPPRSGGFLRDYEHLRGA